MSTNFEEPPFEISRDKLRIEVMFRRGWIIDGRKGGLVLGRSHEEGSVQLVLFEGGRLLHRRRNMEGREYLFSASASLRHREAIEAYRSQYSPEDIKSYTEFKSGLDGVTILDTRGSECPMIWVDDTFGIVNRRSTDENLARLEEMNREKA